jgi:hypothetical protein
VAPLLWHSIVWDGTWIRNDEVSKSEMVLTKLSKTVSMSIGRLRFVEYRVLINYQENLFISRRFDFYGR